MALAPCVQRSTESGSIYTINGNSSGLSSSLIAHFCDVFTDYLKTLNANKAVIEKKYKIEFYWQIKQKKNFWVLKKIWKTKRCTGSSWSRSPLLEAVLLSFIEQICFGAAQVYNLRTSISLEREEKDIFYLKEQVSWIFCCFSIRCQSEEERETHIFLLDGAFFAVVGVGHTRPPTYDAAPLIGAVVTLIANTHQCAGSDVGITDDTLSITWTEKRGRRKV